MTGRYRGSSSFPVFLRKLHVPTRMHRVSAGLQGEGHCCLPGIEQGIGSETGNATARFITLQAEKKTRYGRRAMVHTASNRSRITDVFEVPEEYAGYMLCDPRRRRIGRVRKLFVNAYGEPEYVRVKTSLFELKDILIPVTSIAVDEERRILTLQ